MRTDEAWRHECEVRWPAERPGQEIADFLRKVEKHRGRPAAEKLHSDVRAARKVARESTATSGSNTKG
ncbi:DUF7696 family protein [Cupriavidus sp. IDO]|uniref:DUF7696 family protein n=1 Tax=Cupriavidus sp. IDO TaxID=1539142 RepID=UPI00068A090B|nr:hypothetical protein RM96_17940 [Cupriavidus sp. IDO]